MSHPLQRLRLSNFCLCLSLKIYPPSFPMSIYFSSIYLHRSVYTYLNTCIFICTFIHTPTLPIPSIFDDVIHAGEICASSSPYSFQVSSIKSLHYSGTVLYCTVADHGALDLKLEGKVVCWGPCTASDLRYSLKNNPLIVRMRGRERNFCGRLSQSSSQLSQLGTVSVARPAMRDQSGGRYWRRRGQNAREWLAV